MAQSAMNGKVVLIGGSAGSLDIIFGLVPQLPAKAGAVYVVIVHRKADVDSLLPHLLASRTTLTVREVEDKEPILPDHLYVAPGDYHLLFENETLFSLDCSEKLHHSRPSIDITFESGAQVFHNRVVAVLLSGANGDGAEGLLKVKQAGGTTLVQNPQTAEVPYMPQQAVRIGAATQVVEGEKIGSILREIIVAS